MKNIHFLLLIAILMIACNKENPEPQLSCGEPRPECLDCEWNVFRCKVNGEDWCADCEGDPLFGCDPVDCQFYPDNKTLDISSFGRYAFDIYNYLSISKGDTSQFHFTNGVFEDAKKYPNCHMYGLDTISKSYLYTSDFNTISKLIEGTFEFTAYNECQDTVRVTDGYFKLTYRP